MKSLIIVLVTLLTGFSASAKTVAPLVCSANVDSDSYVKIILNPSQIYVEFWESAYDVIEKNSENVFVAGDKIALLGKKVNVSSEGTTYEDTLNAVMVYSKKEHSLTVTFLEEDGMPIRTEVLLCQ